MGFTQAVLDALKWIIESLFLRKLHRKEQLKEHDRDQLLAARDAAGWIKEQLLDAHEFGCEFAPVHNRIAELHDLQGHLAHLRSVQYRLLYYRRAAGEVLGLLEREADRDETYERREELERVYGSLLEAINKALR